MKRTLLLMVVMVLFGLKIYAANGDLIVNGNVGVGANSPVTKLDVEDYQFVKMGQAAIFIKKDAYISGSIQVYYQSTYPITYKYVVVEAKNLNGILNTRKYVKTRKYINLTWAETISEDSGWVTLQSFTISTPDQGGQITAAISTYGIHMHWTFNGTDKNLTW